MFGGELRTTIATTWVLKALVDIINQGQQPYALLICQYTPFKNGTVIAILQRAELHHLITGTLEVGNPRTLKRPLRVYYALTAKGQEVITDYLNKNAHLLAGYKSPTIS